MTTITYWKDELIYEFQESILFLKYSELCKVKIKVYSSDWKLLRNDIRLTDLSEVEIRRILKEKHEEEVEFLNELYL
jgi:hypothetical protein